MELPESHSFSIKSLASYYKSLSGVALRETWRFAVGHMKAIGASVIAVIVVSHGLLWLLSGWVAFEESMITFLRWFVPFLIVVAFILIYQIIRAPLIDKTQALEEIRIERDNYKSEAKAARDELAELKAAAPAVLVSPITEVKNVRSHLLRVESLGITGTFSGEMIVSHPEDIAGRYSDVYWQRAGAITTRLMRGEVDHIRVGYVQGAGQSRASLIFLYREAGSPAQKSQTYWKEEAPPYVQFEVRLRSDPAMIEDFTQTYRLTSSGVEEVNGT